MGPLVLAWLVGEAILIYRQQKAISQTQLTNPLTNKAEFIGVYPPGPGQLMWSSAVFAMLAILAESEKARPVAILLAWGFDIAALMNVTPNSHPFAIPTKPGINEWPPEGVAPDHLLPYTVWAWSDTHHPPPPGLRAPAVGSPEAGKAVQV